MIKIRPVQESDNDFLWDMLYEMVFFPVGEEKPDKQDLLNQTSVFKYLDGFGQNRTDSGLVVENQDQQLIAAAWFRLFEVSNKGYGYVAADIPELSIAVIQECRGQGIGSQILEALIAKAALEGYKSLSLSVDTRNIACRWYEREGFTKVGGSDTSWIMKRDCY